MVFVNFRFDLYDGRFDLGWGFEVVFVDFYDMCDFGLELGVDGEVIV